MEDSMATRKRLGDMLVEAGLLKEEELHKALKLQVGGNRRLGYLLIKMGLITEEQLQSVLSEQLDLPIVDIGQEFNPAVKHILPRYLCRKYNVIPLDFGDHNMLQLAMADPSDNEALADIEQYTNKVVQPRLASHSNIKSAISKFIPWSIKDIFNPLNSQKLTALTATVALILIAVTILQYNKDRMRTLYGTKRVTQNAVFYQNHELMLEFDNSGKASLQGHGAHSQGSYSITFNDINSLKQFINRKKNDFSTSQQQWLTWAIENQAVE
jgi:hypothetical protein